MFCYNYKTKQTKRSLNCCQFYVFNCRLKNQENKSFEKYRKDFFKNFSKLNKQIEVNKKKLEKVDAKDVVHPYYKNKESSSLTVSVCTICRRHSNFFYYDTDNELF